MVHKLLRELRKRESVTCEIYVYPLQLLSGFEVVIGDYLYTQGVNGVVSFVFQGWKFATRK